MKCWTQIPIRLLVGDYDVITQSVPRSAAVREVRCYTNSTAPVICLALFCGVLLLRLVKVLYKTVTTRRSLTMKQRPNLVISTLHRLLPRSTTLSLHPFRAMPLLGRCGHLWWCHQMDSQHCRLWAFDDRVLWALHFNRVFVGGVNHTVSMLYIRLTCWHNRVSTVEPWFLMRVEDLYGKNSAQKTVVP